MADSKGLSAIRRLLSVMLWGSRFDRLPAERFAQFNNSFQFDWRLYDADIRGSIAYSKALVRAALMTDGEQQAIERGLNQVHDEFARGVFEPKSSDEDIHTAIERRLAELVGAPALKLPTGRSRNDQVATDTRLFMLDAIQRIDDGLRGTQHALLDQAGAHVETLLPGYTHLRRAQPITFAHYLLSFFWMFQRDRERLRDSRPRVAVLPLGSGALAGNPFNLDQEFLARELGFDAVSENSLDAVSDRDFIVEFLACASLIQIHLSRLGEDLNLYSSDEFGFIRIDDAYSTGSSLMPQKKNPDSLELIRGKTGRVIGDLNALLVTLKGLPSTYNKDLQEDKEPLFDAVDTLEMSLPVAEGVIRTMSVNAERMRAALDSALLATDLADFLVARGIPFREAHSKVGALVKEAQTRADSLEETAVAEWGESARTIFDFAESVARRKGYGGTAPDAVREQLKRAKALLEKL